MKDLKELFRVMGVNRTTVEKMVRQLGKDFPDLQKEFREKADDQTFRDFVDDSYQEIEDAFNHDKSPEKKS
jgi:DNA-binding MurR/RpiR family transcriptional regulator